MLSSSGGSCFSLWLLTSKVWHVLISVLWNQFLRLFFKLQADKKQVCLRMIYTCLKETEKWERMMKGGGDWGDDLMKKRRRTQNVIFASNLKSSSQDAWITGKNYISNDTFLRHSILETSIHPSGDSVTSSILISDQLLFFFFYIVSPPSSFVCFPIFCPRAWFYSLLFFTFLFESS